MKKPFKTNLFLKVTLITIIALLLLIPANMIKSLIREREYTQNEAIAEVSSKWGEEQTIAGPIINIPYHRYIRQYAQNDTVGKLIEVKDFLHILPDKLTISGQINPEPRYRGIYEVVVYNSNLEITGTFNPVDFSSFDIPLKDLQLDKAFITIGISDLRGIEKPISLKWNNRDVQFNPGTINKNVLESGINAPVEIKADGESNYNFALALDLKGSQMLYFVPVGQITDVNINSPWQNPSFNGSFLPDSREVGQTGFKANWNILHLNRNFPQSWVGPGQDILSSAFGIDLLLPVDNYQKSMRSIKYAILFIVFTFMVFFFIEILQNIFIHPIQYILVGISLIVFYTLLLSLSEHLSYNFAFITAALATLLLIAGYVKAIIKSGVLTLLITGILLILYTFIFVIIQLQDYALLIGSIGIFAILALVMYFSRKIDWYNIRIEDKKENISEIEPEIVVKE